MKQSPDSEESNNLLDSLFINLFPTAKRVGKKKKQHLMTDNHLCSPII